MTDPTQAARMNPGQLALFLAVTIAARKPVMIPGAPGIGKTQIMLQAARAAGADVILSHPVVSDPTDAKGLPWVSEDHQTARFLPFGDLARAMKADKLTVWILDDLGQAPASVQASFMQLILAREINGHKIPDCVVFLAATNRRTDRAGVTGILEPVKSRFLTIVELVPDIDSSVRFMISQNWNPELIAFLRFRPDLLCDFQPTADLVNSPLPRTWEAVNDIMGLGLPEEIEAIAIAGAVGSGAAVELRAFRRMLHDLPDIDGILIAPDTAPIPDSPGALYAVVTALGMKANSQNFPRVAIYAERLTDAAHGEFAALLLRDIVRRDQSVTQTPAFVKLATGPLGDLIGGNYNV